VDVSKLFGQVGAWTRKRRSTYDYLYRVGQVGFGRALDVPDSEGYVWKLFCLIAKHKKRFRRINDAEIR
jgi:hypothetical protein